MGYKQSWICPICNYKAFTSGEPDRGFRISTNTYVCVDCKTINDLEIEKREPKLINERGQMTGKISEDQECKECGGKQFELWDNLNRPCPKCGTKMQPDPNGMRMNWD